MSHSQVFGKFLYWQAWRSWFFSESIFFQQQKITFLRAGNWFCPVQWQTCLPLQHFVIDNQRILFEIYLFFINGPILIILKCYLIFSLFLLLIEKKFKIQQLSWTSCSNLLRGSVRSQYLVCFSHTAIKCVNTCCFCLMFIIHYLIINRIFKFIVFSFQRSIWH